MIGDYTLVQWVGLSFLFLGGALTAAMLVRHAVPLLQRLYLPSSVVAGFLILLVGPQVLGALTGGFSLFPAEVLRVLDTLPGLLINVVFAGIMLGKRLPSARQIWQESAPHVILGSIFSFGQFALGGFATALILAPFFGFPDAGGPLMEMSFAGGHGTIAGLAGLLTEAGAGELIDVGLGLATISMITGIVGGSLLVNYALRSPRIPVARTEADPPTGATTLAKVTPNSGDQPGELGGLGALTRAFAAIGVAIALGIVLLYAVRGLVQAAGSDLLDDFPLFPFAVVGGFLVQLVLSATHHEALVDRRSVNDISGLALDLLIAAAIGTMSLAALGANLPSLVVITALAFGWSVFGLLVLGPLIHRRDWFSHAIADYGQSQGNVAAGFILADMADPRQVTTAARAYGYKQLLYGPLLGGGILTALSVPLVLSIGSLPFALLASVVVIALILWGALRDRAGVAPRRR